MPFEPFRTHTQHVNLDDLDAPLRRRRRRSTWPRSSAPAWRRKRDIPVKVLGRGELDKPLTVHAHSFSKTRPRADRGRRRDLPAHRVPSRRTPMVATILNAFKVAEIRKKLAFTAALLALYRLGSFIPVPGVNLGRARAARRTTTRVEHPRLPQPVHGRRAVADRDLRARDHAVHHGLDHPAAADGGLAVAGEAAEGGRGRAGADHAVHALPDRRRSPPRRPSATSSSSARRATARARRCSTTSRPARSS